MGVSYGQGMEPTLMLLGMAGKRLAPSDPDKSIPRPPTIPWWDDLRCGLQPCDNVTAAKQLFMYVTAAARLSVYCHALLRLALHAWLPAARNQSASCHCVAWPPRRYMWRGAVGLRSQGFRFAMGLGLHPSVDDTAQRMLVGAAPQAGPMQAQHLPALRCRIALGL